VANLSENDLRGREPFTHSKTLYDLNARVISANYYSQLSKLSHLQLELWVVNTCTNMSRLVANTSHPENNHYISNLNTIWTTSYSGWVLVALVFQPAMRLQLCCHLFHIFYCRTIIHIILKTVRFSGEVIEYKMSITLSPQTLSETFLILIKIQGGFVTKVHNSSCKLPVIIVEF